MTDEPDFNATVTMVPAPPLTASKDEQMEWLVECGCTLGRVISDLCRKAGADDKRITLVMHYMAGRSRGFYVSEDTYGAQGCDAFYSMGVDHGKEAAAHQMEARATAPSTETKQ